MSDRPAVLALDFDGVICDGRAEYLASAWRAHAALWPATLAEPPSAVAARFTELRPLVESGWEMPLLLHALLAGAPDASFWDRRAWQEEAGRQLTASGVARESLGRALNDVRDHWFARDPAGWVALHRYYPGIAPRVRGAVDDGIVVVVVTTKAERFTRALLAAASPSLADVPVVGREPDRVVPKPTTLARLALEHGLPRDGAGLWFVEDLPDTLDAVAAAGLAGVRRFLAGWGYNTLEERATASARSDVTLLSLARFPSSFAQWL